MSTTTMAIMKGSGVWRKGIRSEEMRPMRLSVTRSPRQEAIAGAMLSAKSKLWSVKWIQDVPGSRLNLRQRTIRAHMKEPSRRPDKHAAVMVDEATITNLVG